MAAMTEATQPMMLQVAAVWGTTVVTLRSLRPGESFTLSDDDVEGIFSAPEGMNIAPAPVRSVAGGWEIHPQGTKMGILKIRGRDEDPVALGQSGASIQIVPGDYGLLQYGLFSIFFQYRTPAPRMRIPVGIEVLVALALFSSFVFHIGLLGLVRAMMTPPPIAKPLELVSPEEYAARFGLHRTLIEEPPPPTPAEAGDKTASSGVKDPGARDKKQQGGGQKIKGAEGKLGLKGAGEKTEIPGEIKPVTNYGGLSEVLSSETGQEIKQTLKSIDSVASALGGLNSQNLVLGAGTGTSLKGGGSGGGGTGAGVAFGSGTLQTGWGQGVGGGYGGGSGGPGGKGSGGNGHGGTGGSGAGLGNGPGEAKVAGAAGSVAAHSGLTAAQIQRVVVAHQGALRACYEIEAQRNPNLRGGVTVNWQIDPSGSVTAASLGGTTINNPRVEGCVIRQIKTWKFPSSDSASSPTYPFKFGVGG